MPRRRRSTSSTTRSTSVSAWSPARRKSCGCASGINSTTSSGSTPATTSGSGAISGGRGSTARASSRGKPPSPACARFIARRWRSRPMTLRDKARVALVHDWLTGMRGGEKVLEVLCERFPHAELFTLLHVRGSVSPLIEGRPIHSSMLQRLPGARRHYREYLPLFPALIEQLDLERFDLVISTSHC